LGCLGGILICGLWLSAASTAIAQDDRTKPGPGYFAAFGPFHDGDYQTALRAFKDESRHGIKTIQSRWIDSICYETMMGECQYEMGNLAVALDHYTAAVKLYVAFYDWMLRVQFPPAIRPYSTNKACPWGASARNAKLGHYPSSILISQGRLNNNETIQKGGIVQAPILYPLNVQEIVRCTTLAIRRRTKLLGPVCAHDPLTAELAAALTQRPAPPNHWSEAWVNVQLGLALVALGKEAQGISALNMGILAAGEYDHPMTSIALLELGRLAMSKGDFRTAEGLCTEATYASFYYPDPSVMEEAFRYGALAHLLANRQGAMPTLATAAQWAKQNKLRPLQTSLLLSAAENCLTAGQSPQAAKLLEEARLAMGRRSMGAGRIGARCSFLLATVCFQQKRVAEGETALTAAMNYMRQSSFWLFHIALADRLFLEGAFQPRLAMDLYKELLRDPQPGDWASDPMETLGVMVTPHPLPYEHWFEAALLRKDHELALEIADRARRHRFYNTLALGGRLLSLRWVLEGPVEALDRQAQMQRQDLLARYPVYSQLSQQSRAMRTALSAMPLVAEDTAILKQQSQAFGQLAAVSLQQEAILREMAVRREPASLIFPPVRTVADVQKTLPKGHAILAFFATSRQMYGFLLNDEKYGYWPIASAPGVSKELTALLRDLGQYGPLHEIPVKDLGEGNWKQPAGRLLDQLLKGSRADFAQKFDELIIVPDGLLWYVPFEALQVNVGGKQRPLIAQARIRYAPTVSLASTKLGHGRRATGNTAVVCGKLFPRDDYGVSQAAFEQLAKVLPGAAMLKSPLPAPSSVYSSLFHRLVVFDDINVAGLGPYDWAPVTLEKNKPGNSLNDWLGLPWGGPDEVILPGYHTAAEDATLKGMNRLMPGHEIFLSICGLMASGSRTILLSRWRTGGQTSYDIVREFTQELPHIAPSEAWQRAVFLTAGSQLNLAAEPRVASKRGSNPEEAPKANHPFFWAGYMLVDPGVAPAKDGGPGDAPVIKVKPDGGPDAKPGAKADDGQPAPKLKLIELDEPPAKEKPAVGEPPAVNGQPPVMEDPGVEEKPAKKGKTPKVKPPVRKTR
jgi:tetratricopeptide (TPR) repeat protein